jgi:hypothetical protein
MTTPDRSKSDASHIVDPCQWTSYLNEEPPKPYKIHVHGQCNVPIGSSAELRYHEPQGFNPEVLMLDWVLVPPEDSSATRTAEQKTVEVSYTEETSITYKWVTILPAGTTIPVREVF